MTTPDEQTVDRVADALSAFSHRPRGVILESARAAIAAMPHTKALEAADGRGTLGHLTDALSAIALAGECDVSQKMNYGGVLVETSQGPKMASLTLTLKKPARGGKA